MDWTLAISRNREALLLIVVALMKRVGLVDGGALTTLPFYLHRAAVLILRPAEAAVRRLIMVVAHEMKLRGVKMCQTRSQTRGQVGDSNARPALPFPNTADFAPSFNLIDPLKTFGPERPDYACFGAAFDSERGSTDRTPIAAAGLGRRLLALKNALGSLQKQARRLSRWYARQDVALRQNQPSRYSPMRPGRPPGYRKPAVHEVESVLRECHGLAHDALDEWDSS